MHFETVVAFAASWQMEEASACSNLTSALHLLQVGSGSLGLTLLDVLTMMKTLQLFLETLTDAELASALTLEKCGSPSGLSDVGVEVVEVH